MADGARTHDNWNHNPGLYQLSYSVFRVLWSFLFVLVLLWSFLENIMATYRKRNGKWQARIQRASGTSQARTFFTMRDAKLWARKVERDIDLGVHTIKPALITVGEAFKRYLTEVTPRKKKALPLSSTVFKHGDFTHSVVVYCTTSKYRTSQHGEMSRLTKGIVPIQSVFI